MVNARLHIICGNCGSKDLKWRAERDFIDLDGENFKDECVISCQNCATLHFMSHVLEEEVDDSDAKS